MKNNILKIISFSLCYLATFFMIVVMLFVAKDCSSVHRITYAAVALSLLFGDSLIGVYYFCEGRKNCARERKLYYVYFAILASVYLFMFNVMSSVYFEVVDVLVNIEVAIVGVGLMFSFIALLIENKECVKESDKSSTDAQSQHVESVADEEIEKTIQEENSELSIKDDLIENTTVSIPQESITEIEISEDNSEKLKDDEKTKVNDDIVLPQIEDEPLLSEEDVDDGKLEIFGGISNEDTADDTFGLDDEEDDLPEFDEDSDETDLEKYRNEGIITEAEYRALKNSSND